MGFENLYLQVAPARAGFQIGLAQGQVDDLLPTVRQEKVELFAGSVLHLTHATSRLPRSLPPANAKVATIFFGAFGHIFPGAAA